MTPLTPGDRHRLQQEVLDELEDFRRLLIEDRVAAGRTLAEAEAEAGRRLDDVDRIVDDCVQVHDQDPLRAGVRAAHTTLILALGFAIAATLFLFVNGVFHRAPLAFRDDAQRVALWWLGPPGTDWQSTSSLSEFHALRQLDEVFEHVTVAAYVSVTLGDPCPPELTIAKYVSADYFHLYGVEPLLGRGFAADEVEDSARPVTVLSHDTWRKRFSGAMDVVGRTLEVNGRPHTVVGVLPPDVPMYSNTAIFIPLATADEDPDHAAWLMAGRLRPGVGFREASRRVQERLQAMVPTQPETRRDMQPFLRRLENVYSEPLRGRLGLWSAVAGVCLLGVVAHALSRRLAHGAAAGRGPGRGLLEAALMAVGAAVIGLLLAGGAARFLAGPVMGDLWRLFDLRTDLRVLAFAGILTVLLALGLGIAGGFGRTRSESRPAGTLRRRRLRCALLSLQLSLGIVLALCAQPLVARWVQLAARDPGFRAEGLLTIEVLADRESQAERRELMARLVQRVEALPEVTGVSFAQSFPTQKHYWTPAYRAADAPDSAPIKIPFNAVDTRYLSVLGAPLLDGRLPDPGDTPETRDVIVINRTLAERMWPGSRAVGRSLVLVPADRSFEVVGVVGDVRHEGLHRPALPMLYRPYSQYAVPEVLTLVVRARGRPEALAPVVLSALRSEEPSLAHARPESAQARLWEMHRGTGFAGLVLAVLASLLLLPAVAGLAGLTIDGDSQPSFARLRLVVAVGAGGVVAGGALAWVLDRADTPLADLLSGLDALGAATIVAAVLAAAALSVWAATHRGLPASRRSTRGAGLSS